MLNYIKSARTARSNSKHDKMVLEKLQVTEGKSLGICGTSLDVENFSKGLMCLSTSGNYTQVEILTGNC